MQKMCRAMRPRPQATATGFRLQATGYRIQASGFGKGKASRQRTVKKCYV